jgi:uncharacterized protein involved in high-affinity Fe2+ transport
MSRSLRAGGVTLGALACLAFAGCGSQSTTVTTVPVGQSAGSGMSETTGGGSMQATQATASMAGMSMSGSSNSVTAGGIKAIPTQVLGSAQWQGMRITAQAMTAVPFVIFNGNHERTVKPAKHVSFHLMVMLDDARTKYPIPYAGVWATIRERGKVVYDERQWPMLSEYIGPHYGNDVALPGAGHYQLSLLVSPPVSARHMEYQRVWLKPHRVTVAFNWNPKA